MGVRPLDEADLPQVADLYWRYMRRRKGAVPPPLVSLLRELYFQSPFTDRELPSLVYADQGGKIRGFLGSIVRKMSVRGQSVRVAFAGNFIVHPDFRSGLATPRLIEKMVTRKHDISMVDSANTISRSILERLGHRTLGAMNIHWRRLLRPSHYAIYGLSQATGPIVSTSLKIISKPFCSLADSLAARISASPFRQTKPRLHGADLDVETLLQCLIQFRTGYSLWPEYDAQSLRWLLSFMESRPARGRLRKVVLRADSQKIVGWYIYYVKRGSVGEVVQVGGEPQFTKDILDHLFYDAWERGVIALHGVVDNQRMPDFSSKGCFFTCRGGWTLVQAYNPAHAELFERGDVFLSRLDGEWALDPGV